jgi:hypothetical protein
MLSDINQNWIVGEDIICSILGFDTVWSCDRRFGGTYRHHLHFEVRVPEDGRDRRVIEICDLFETLVSMVRI